MKEKNESNPTAGIIESEDEQVCYLPGYGARIEEIDKLPRRNPLLHWLAFLLSLVSTAILILWMSILHGKVTPGWVWLDIGLAAFFFIEFFTRSGFHWNPVKYSINHIFDLAAIIPALVFIHNGVFAETLWIWVILIARVTRSFDRLLGDGFLIHNFLVLLEGFEEGITDRVTLRIMARLQIDMIQGKFGHTAAEAMQKNKTAVLNRIREEHPHDSLTADLARFVGLEAAVERAESRIYDAMVDVLKSPEVDKVIEHSLNEIFRQLRAETGKREWVKHLGIPGRHNPELPVN